MRTTAHLLAAAVAAVTLTGATVICTVPGDRATVRPIAFSTARPPQALPSPASAPGGHAPAGRQPCHADRLQATVVHPDEAARRRTATVRLHNTGPRCELPDGVTVSIADRGTVLATARSPRPGAALRAGGGATVLVTGLTASGDRRCTRHGELRVTVAGDTVRVAAPGGTALLLAACGAVTASEVTADR